MEGARAAGHEVEHLLLREMDFAPVLPGGFTHPQPLEPPLANARDDALVRAPGDRDPVLVVLGPGPAHVRGPFSVPAICWQLVRLIGKEQAQTLEPSSKTG